MPVWGVKGGVFGSPHFFRRCGNRRNEDTFSSSHKGVRSFLGLVGYYRKFVRGFGIIAAQLTKLLTKDGFCWSEKALLAFNELKKALTSPPVLRLPDFSQQFVVECEA